MSNESFVSLDLEWSNPSFPTLFSLKRNDNNSLSETENSFCFICICIIYWLVLLVAIIGIILIVLLAID